MGDKYPTPPCVVHWPNPFWKIKNLLAIITIKSSIRYEQIKKGNNYTHFHKEGLVKRWTVHQTKILSALPNFLSLIVNVTSFDDNKKLITWTWVSENTKPVS